MITLELVSPFSSEPAGGYVTFAKSHFVCALEESRDNTLITHVYLDTGLTFWVEESPTTIAQTVRAAKQ